MVQVISGQITNAANVSISMWYPDKDCILNMSFKGLTDWEHIFNDIRLLVTILYMS